MNRRSFLASLLATAVLDPERLLWVQKKTIFIPPVPGLAFHKYAFTMMVGVDLDVSNRKLYICGASIKDGVLFINKEGFYELKSDCKIPFKITNSWLESSAKI